MANKVLSRISKIKSPSLSVGFSNLDMWIDSGNHAINFLNSGEFGKAFLFGRNYIFYGESGCHTYGTKVRREDGKLIEVQNVRTGDKLLAPQGGYNTVIRTIVERKSTQMYSVVPTDSIMARQYDVNGEHILHLVKVDGKTLKHKNVSVNTYIEMKMNGDIEGWKMIRTFSHDGTEGDDTGPQSEMDLLAYGANMSITSSIPYWLYSHSTLYQRQKVALGMLEHHAYHDSDNDTYVLDCGQSSNAERIEDFLMFAGYTFKRTQPAIISVKVEPNDDGYEIYDFKIEESVISKYYGFELDGNQLYHLEDFTVTHNSAKSLLCATCAANAQKEHDALVVWIDVERATDDDAGKEWFKSAGMSLEDDSFIYLTASTLEEIKTIITNIAVDYRNEVKGGADPTSLQPIVFVVDSWAAALTDSQWEKVGGKEAGIIKGDMGQKAKQLGDVITAVTQISSGIPLITFGVQHVMDNQDQYGRKHKTTGGHKLMYMASGSMMLTKKEMRLEDVDDPEVLEYYEELGENITADLKKRLGGTKRIVGIVSKAEVLKSRTAKPFHSVDIQIPQEVGIDRYSGLFDLMMSEGMITTPASGWYAYQYKKDDGEVEEVKFRKKDFRKNSHHEKIMELYNDDLLIQPDLNTNFFKKEETDE